MCSLAGDVMIEETTVTANKTKHRMDICKKCTVEKPSVILRKTDAYCKSCFLTATVHKFRATLGKHHIVRKNERVLVIYQKGHSGSALLHFLRSGLNMSQHKKLRLEPVILYIDEHEKSEKLSSDERIELCETISKEISSCNFPGYFSSLNNFIKNFNQPPVCIEMTQNLSSDIKSLIKSEQINFSDSTQYGDVMDVSRRQLIIKVAKQLKCRVIFTSEISVDVAIKLLSNIALGRGSHLSLDVGVLDDRDADVSIFQPLRYFDIKELALYNFYNNVEPVIVRSQNEKVPSNLHNLMTTFVHDLQENYPSTIKTVVRTGDKLTCDKTGNICGICKAPVEIQNELSSSEASDFSHWVSTHAQDRDDLTQYKNGGKFNSKLCFACRKISHIIGEEFLIT